MLGSLRRCSNRNCSSAWTMDGGAVDDGAAVTGTAEIDAIGVSSRMSFFQWDEEDLQLGRTGGTGVQAKKNSDGEDSNSTGGESRPTPKFSFRRRWGEQRQTEDIFAVTEENRLFSSGAFFAVKIQAARSKQQLSEFATEVDNFRKLRGNPNIVQIRDHTLLWDTLHLVILMELGACDLLRFHTNTSAASRGTRGTSDHPPVDGGGLTVDTISQLWRALLRAVDASHQQDIIHRDLKPQNFLLVPVEPFADRILATTPTAPEKFRFWFVGEGNIIALALEDVCTGEEVVLRLVIKLSDFGLAQPLNLEQSHLSVHGHAGTLRYMAPETVQPTMDCRRQLSKRVDIWALGMMLFQMLHNGRTPFDRFFTKGHIEAAVAIASKVVHTEVIKFDRAGLWAAERSLSWQQGNFFSSDIASPSCV